MLALLLLVLVQTSWSQFQEHPRPITATAGDGQPVKLGQWHQGKIIITINPLLMIIVTATAGDGQPVKLGQ